MYHFNVPKLKSYRRNRNVKLIKEAVENSDTPEEAAQKLENTVRTLKDYLKIYKINAKNFRKKKDFYSDLKKEDVVKALKSSRSVASAAKLLGVSHNKLDSFIYHNKIPTLFISIINNKEALIHTLLTANSMHDASRSYNVSSTRSKKALMENDLEEGLFREMEKKEKREALVSILEDVKAACEGPFYLKTKILSKYGVSKLFFDIFLEKNNLIWVDEFDYL